VARGGAAAKVEGGMQIKTADGYVFKLKEKKIVPPVAKEPSVEGVLQCFAVCFSALQCVLQCDAVCCSVLQCVAVFCSIFKEPPVSAAGT